MDFRDNCGIVYDPRIIETVKNVQVQFYPDFLRNTSFLLILDMIKIQTCKLLNRSVSFYLAKQKRNNSNQRVVIV